MKLNKDTVARLTLPEGKSDQIWFDDDLPGFGVRLRAGGKGVWIIQYRVGVQQRRETLGDIRKVDLKAAREAARQRFAAVTLGSDPAAEKAAERAAAKVTLGSVIDRYLAVKQAAVEQATLRPKSYHETQRYLRESFKPLHGLPVHKVERRNVAARIGEIVTENGPVAAIRARAAISAFFAWAMGEGLADSNPVIGTNRPDGGGARDRVLSDAELAKIWTALPESDFGRVMKLLTLTGQRREEIAGLRWSEIDLDKRIISLPASRTKNKRPHDIPLSDSAIDVLSECPRRDGRDLVFGVGKGGFGGVAKAKERLDAAISQTKPWRLHDIRRTVATVMADKLGVQPHVVEAVLNHVSGHKAGVAGTYNRAVYAKEKREALTLWADYVRSIVEGTKRKVVPLRSGEGAS
jgi:integrase